MAVLIFVCWRYLLQHRRRTSWLSNSHLLKARAASTRDGCAKEEEKQPPFASPYHLIAVPFLMLVHC